MNFKINLLLKIFVGVPDYVNDILVVQDEISLI
jgi:hypothetical protein